MANRWWAGNVAMDPNQSPGRQQEFLHDNSNSGGRNYYPNPKRNRDKQNKEDDQALVEFPRGCPPGSKNKRQPPIVIMKDSPCALQSNIFMISSGSDVAVVIAGISQRRHRGVVVLNGSECCDQMCLSGRQRCQVALSRYMGDLKGMYLQQSPVVNTGSSESQSYWLADPSTPAT